jgi:hypothetical protein
MRNNQRPSGFEIPLDMSLAIRHNEYMTTTAKRTTKNSTAVETARSIARDSALAHLATYGDVRFVLEYANSGAIIEMHNSAALDTVRRALTPVTPLSGVAVWDHAISGISVFDPNDRHRIMTVRPI